ncbi:abortive infection family protein [Desulfocurvibacter africanus]|uniref:abortive infection family protein n=1 Tax=Desulfocurvibacter africanus TaxID=873 RepID=UPI002FD90C04
MLQQTFAALEREFADGNDACIDAAKGIVECTCRVLIENLDNPSKPVKPQEGCPDFGAWVSAAVRVLKLSEVRDEAFKKLVSQHHKLTNSLGALRNAAGPVSHGKDAFIAKLSAHHRRAALLAADAIVTFLHEAYLEREPDPSQTLEPYERFAEANRLIDDYTSVEAATDIQNIISIVIRLPNGEEMPLLVEVSRLLFHADREAYKQALEAAREAEAVMPAYEEVK